MRIILISMIFVFLVACQPFEYEPQVSIIDELDEIVEQNEEFLINTTNQTISNQTIDASRAAYKITGVEGDLIRIPVRAIDPDGGPVELSFSEPFNEQGLWLTTIGDEGRYLVQVSAYDGFVTSREYVLVEVQRANRPPVIDCPSTIRVQETQTVNIECNIFDVEGHEFNVSYEGWMNSSTKQTTFGDRGEHQVLVRATDELGATATKEIRVVVNRTNRAPIIENLQNKQVQETQTIALNVTAYDPDGDNISIMYSEPFDQNGVFTPDFGDRGTYNVTVTATDGELSATETFTLTVIARNRAPVIEEIAPITVNEGQIVSIPVNAYDPDGDDVVISFSGWMNSSEYQTTYDDAHPLGCDERGCTATYFVTVTASDGQLETSRTVQINVVDVNRPPQFIFGEN
ncbi:MAG: Ig-like domain-containing protein [Candidatus Woesearchaeota archaeon]